MRLDVQAALVRGELIPGDVEIQDGLIVDVGLPGGTRGRVAVPGFVDLQVNGYGGIDFLSASTLDYDMAGGALLEGGVTAYQPTFITAPESAMLDALRAMPANGSSPRVVGAHVEGPFLSPERLGTHPLRAPARSRPGLARTAPGRRPCDGVHARARARGRRHVDQALARARGRRLRGTHERDRGAGARRLRSRRVDRLPLVQRDASVPVARSWHRRSRADAPRRLRADDRRRTSPRRRDGAPDLGGRRRTSRPRQRCNRGRGRRDRPVPARRHGDRRLGWRADARRRRLGRARC